MALTKVTYVDEETLIEAQNLNDIQDAIISLENSHPFKAILNTTTYAEVLAAYNSGKLVYTVNEGTTIKGIFILMKVDIGTSKMEFWRFVSNNTIAYHELSPSGWSTLKQTQIVVRPDIANQYMTSSEYGFGSFVYQSNHLYRCISEIPVTGAFDATKWRAASVAEYLKFLSDSIATAGKVKTVNGQNPDQNGNIQLDGSDIYVDGSAQSPVSVKEDLTFKSQQIADLESSDIQHALVHMGLYRDADGDLCEL